MFFYVIRYAYDLFLNVIRYAHDMFFNVMRYAYDMFLFFIKCIYVTMSYGVRMTSFLYIYIYMCYYVIHSA